MEQKEIISEVPVLDDMGNPWNFGWAKSMNFIYNPGLVIAPRRSVHESDRYIAISPTHMITAEIQDNGYLGYIGMTLVSLKEKKQTTQYWKLPFPLGSYEFPGSSEEGHIKVQGKKYFFNFSAMDKGVRIIKFDIPRFNHNMSLRGKLVLTPVKAAESLLTHMPWREKRHAFRCARRSPWYIAEGVILYGTNELVFTSGNSWGIYEWNRGVRPRADVRFWAAGCGRSSGKQVGISVGYDSADSTHGTENAFFLDGKIQKLDQVTFQVSPSNWLLPWRFTSNDGRLEMVFVPLLRRTETLQMFFHLLKRRQIYGTFSGKVILDNKREFEFQNIAGFAERRKTYL